MISSVSLFDFHPLFTIRSRIINNRQSIFRRPHVASSFTRHSIQAFAQVKSKLQVVNRCFVSLLLTKINRKKVSRRRFGVGATAQRELVRVAVVSISQECFSSVWEMRRKTARRRRVSGLCRTSRNAIKIVHQLQLNVSLVYSFCSLRHMIYSYALWSDLYAITIAIRVRQSKVHFAMKRILDLWEVREAQGSSGIGKVMGFELVWGWSY